VKLRPVSDGRLVRAPPAQRLKEAIDINNYQNKPVPRSRS
jgi:hypothetical protein